MSVRTRDPAESGKKRFPRAALAVLLLASAVICSYIYLRPAGTPGATPDVLARANDLISEGRYRGRVSLTDGSIAATGNGEILNDTAQGRLLAKRAALTDARRNLLMLRHDAMNGEPSRGASGRIGTHRVTSERAFGGTYEVEVEMSLDEWLSSDFSY
ncbi:MAG: hypothetical protein LBS75_10370 [Synergistaceae bacterium]|jgi:hypothetical protein|nr:hypothetical protein [Synergistaceae bacterium]